MKLKIQKNYIVKFIAPNVFAVYLIHNHCLCLPFLKTWLGEADMSMVAVSLLASMIIFLSSVFIDKIVKHIALILRVEQMETKLALVIENRMRQWLK